MPDIAFINPNFSRLFQAAGASAVNNERIAIILGLITLALALTVLASCRICLSGLKRIGLGRALESQAYQGFYRFHSYYWWLFGVFLVGHLAQAFIHTGLPQAGDPDASVHWIILGLGLGGLLAAGTIFFSCRLFFRLSKMLSMLQKFNSQAFLAFHKPHTFYWLIFLLLVGAHFAEGFRHAGIWPSP
jgi:hypothetical protein